MRCPMDNLELLKDCVLTGKDTADAVEACYGDFLDSYDARHATVFLNLLEMGPCSPRTQEILKVLDFVRFPVKKTVQLD